ncbi:fasciclin-2-like [Pomacea canaliculata]|uniref:fasciclin-2-like n=1 Tax=Pomacea canaliculata TaxID=400727 RepID=UPI000D736B8D|nr:fasciclin-2-like [Pomacea canaliculata]
MLDGYHGFLLALCLIVPCRASDSREKKMQALEGAMGLLECPVFQYGSGQRVTWTKERSVEVTKISPRLTVNQRSGALRIHRAQFTDSGRYTCTVRDGNDTMSRDTTLDVVSYPRITMVQNASVARGEEATLLCKVESTPASDISWHRLDVPLGPPEVTAAPQSENTMDYDVFTSTSEGVTSVTVSELRYRSVQPGHAGLYLCLAANDPGSARAILALSVIYAPIATVPEPVVVAWAGKVPDIHMIFKATPPPRVSCFHDNQTVGPNSHWIMFVDTHEEITNVTLKIDPEKASNETDIYTNYSCTATNTVGQTTASVTVTEGRAPDPPQVRIDSQRPTWIVLEITMPPYMGIPPADRIVTRYEDLTSLEEIKEFDEAITPRTSETNQKWNLTGLQPGHTYRLVMHLSNTLANSKATVLTTTLPLHAAPDPVQFVSPPQGDYPRAYVLRWLAPVTHGAPLSNYTLSYAAVAVREGEDGVRVERVIGPEHPVTVQRMAKTLVISGLSENTFYRVNMTAHNNVGASAPSIFIFRTGNDTAHGERHQDIADRPEVHYSRLPPDTRNSQVQVEETIQPGTSLGQENSSSRTLPRTITPILLAYLALLLSTCLTRDRPA